MERPSGDAEFQADLQQARDTLVGLAQGGAEYVAVPVPGSATYANEAVIAALVPPGRTLLVHSNGVYGDRLVEICEAIGTQGRGAADREAFTPARGGAVRRHAGGGCRRSATCSSCIARPAPAS